MRVLAIIPARGGSKGVPRKNLRHVGSKSLVGWAVHAARESRMVDRTIVSTDDPQIAREARMCGAEVDSRPPYLATDEALTAPVLVELVGRMDPKPDIVVLLQPTVPMRRAGLVDECIHKVAEDGYESALTAGPLHFVWWKEQNSSDHIDEQGDWRCQCPRRPRRQDMRARELMWHEDGAVFAVRSDILLQTGNHVAGRVDVVPNDWSVDIDTWPQLLAVDAIMRAREAGNG